MGLALDELKENEETVQVNSIDLLISDSVKPYTDGNTLDYVQTEEGPGFILGKPGQTGCDGCSSC